jgi:hypothetical protein
LWLGHYSRHINSFVESVEDASKMLWVQPFLGWVDNQIPAAWLQGYNSNEHSRFKHHQQVLKCQLLGFNATGIILLKALLSPIGLVLKLQYRSFKVKNNNFALFFSFLNTQWLCKLFCNFRVNNRGCKAFRAYESRHFTIKLPSLEGVL